MKYFERISAGLGVGRLLQAIQDNPQLWDEITIRQDWPGSPHHDTQCIWLRGPQRITLESVFTDKESHDYGAMDTLMPAIADLITPQLRGLGVTDLGRVMIVNLKAGGSIDWHFDEGSYAEHYSRFHLALTSEEGNLFVAGDEAVHMQAGEMWWFDHRAMHTVVNDSQADRIHVIIDAVTPKHTVRVNRGEQHTIHGITQVDYATAMEQASPLLREHWDEVALNKQLMMLKPDHRRYIELQSKGALFILAAYEQGRLIGYSANVIGTHLHYADLVVANNDVLFVHKDYRQSPIGLKLIRQTEVAAKQKGARLMLWHAKQDSALDQILPRMRCQVQDIIYSKEL